MARSFLVPAALLLPVLAFAADRPLLGRSLVVKSPTAGNPGWRKIVARAVEPAGGATLSGDPTSPVYSAGGMLQVILEGVIPSRQTFTFRSTAAVTITLLSWPFETDVFVRDGNVPLSDHEALAVRFGWAIH